MTRKALLKHVNKDNATPENDYKLGMVEKTESEYGAGVRSQKLMFKNDIITPLRLFHIDGFDYKQFALDYYQTPSFPLYAP